MKLSKIISIITVAGITVSLFSGCGGDKNISDSGSSDKPVLKVLQMYTKEDVNNHIIAKLLEERTGYKINYETLPQDKPYDKLNLLLAGGESYDVVSMGNNKNVYAKYAANGALFDLQPLLDKHGENLKTKISQKSFDILKVNDKQYGIPNTSTVGVSAGILIRTDWLKKVGMELPTTIDEFTKVLSAFKDKDPGNNGAEKNAPFVMTSENTFVPNIQGAFGLATDWQPSDGKLVANVTRPEFKEYLHYLRSLYKGGLIDKEFAVYKAVNAKEKFTSGQAGAIILGWFDMQTVMDSLKKNQPEATCAYVPLLKNKDGDSAIALAGAGVDKIIFIPKSSSNPEHAMKWMNAKLDDETFKLYTIGEEGVHYKMENGKYLPILPKFFEDRNASSIYLTGIDEAKYTGYWQARIRKEESIFNSWNYLNNDEEYKKHQVMDVISYAPYIADYSNNVQTISVLVNDFMLKEIVSDEPIDAAVDKFVEKWRSQGGKSMEDSLNEWYKTVKDNITQ